MSWVGLAAARIPAAEECLQAEFKVAHAHDALDGSFAQFGSQRQNVRSRGPELLVLHLHPVQLARLVG